MATKSPRPTWARSDAAVNNHHIPRLRACRLPTRRPGSRLVRRTCPGRRLTPLSTTNVRGSSSAGAGAVVSVGTVSVGTVSVGTVSDDARLGRCRARSAAVADGISARLRRRHQPLVGAVPIDRQQPDDPAIRTTHAADSDDRRAPAAAGRIRRRRHRRLLRSRTAAMASSLVAAAAVVPQRRAAFDRMFTDMAESIVHRASSSFGNSRASVRRARASDDLTVPVAMPRTPATSAIGIWSM